MQHRSGMPPEKFNELLEIIKPTPKAIIDILEKFQKDLSDKQTTTLLRKSLYKQYDILYSFPPYLRTPENYLLAVKADGRAISIIPKGEWTEELCIEAVKSNGTMLQHIPKDKFSNEIYTKIYKAAIEQNGTALKFIHEDLRTFEICLAAVRSNPFALESVPKNTFSLDQYLTLCKEAVELNGEALEYVPEKLFKEEDYHKLYITAVKKSAKALYCVPEEKRTFDMFMSATKIKGAVIRIAPPNKFTKEEYKQLYSEAVKRDGSALEFVPEEYKDLKLCLAAVKDNRKAVKYFPKLMFENENILLALKKNGYALEYYKKAFKKDGKQLTEDMIITALNQCGLALEYVSKKLRNEAYCTKAVENNGMALEFVPKNIQEKFEHICMIAVKQNGLALKFVEKKTFDLCLAAVQENGAALQWVPEEMKAKIIKTVTPEKILFDNYGARKYFPATQEFNHEIDSFLSKIKNIVVTNDGTLEEDYELRDIFMVYGNAPKRLTTSQETKVPPQTTLHLDESSLYLLSEELQRLHATDVNLVLLDHANESFRKMSGLSMDDVIEQMENYPFITGVELLGCNTAKSIKLEQEKEMTKVSSKGEFEEVKEPKYGLISISHEPVEQTYISMFNKSSLDALFLFSKNEQGESTVRELVRENDQVKIIRYSLSKTQIQDLQNLLTKGKNLFPRVLSQVNSLRSETQPLEQNKIQPFIDICHKVNLFDKEHSDYHATKKKTPFLSTAVIDKDEAKEKLSQSLLKSLVTLVDEAKKNGRIKQAVIVGGRPGGLHVDTLKRRLHVTRKAYLYKSVYRVSLYASKKDFLNRKKLEVDRKKSMDPLNNQTSLKHIKVKFS